MMEPDQRTSTARAASPGVRLVGELQGAAFEERQWLVERHGAFLQLTELL